MPVQTPAGPIATLEELQAEARSGAAEAVLSKFPGPVLVVRAPAEGFGGSTQVSAVGVTPSSAVNYLPLLVVAVARGKLNANPSRMSVGRSAVCDVIVPFSAISKVHAFLSQSKDGAWQVEDVGSTNGIVMGKTRLVPGKRLPLADGAELVCGDVTCVFHTAPAFARLLE